MNLSINKALQTYTYTLPTFWSSALINGDVSGFSDEEREQLDDWNEDHPGLICVDGSEEVGFTKTHDAPECLACDCAVYTFYPVQPTIEEHRG